MEEHPAEGARRCGACGHVDYPSVYPAVIVRVEKDGKILLARHVQRSQEFFTCLAGYVEVGESLEDAVHREVREEVGIEITNLRYFCSQPWPFPDSLMLAFFADYAGGEIAPDPAEIEEAGWFALDALPPLPDPVSIARRLIDAAVLTGS